MSIDDRFYRRYETLRLQGVPHADEWLEQRQRLGGFARTTAVDGATWLALILFLPLFTYAPGLLLYLAGYVTAGLVINMALGAVQLDRLPALSPFDKRLVRYFYAWFWPLAAWAWWRTRRRTVVE